MRVIHSIPILVSLCAVPAAVGARDCPDCPEMVVIPGGQFLMGVAPGEEDRENLAEEFRYRSEPRRRVALKSFHAGKYEVTRGEFRAFAEATGRGSDGCFFWAGEGYQFDPRKDWRNPGFAQDDRHPVACVSWEDAAAYAQWLSGRTGKRYRLLTEAEWEYAARAGTTTLRYWGDDASASCSYANGADVTTLSRVPGAHVWPAANCNDGHAYTAPVGSYRANAWGLHDMSGNVAEWTQDCWNGNYRDAPVDGRAATAGDCFLRMVRGGAWDESPTALRAAYRVGSPQVVRVYTRGFRVARDD